mgnify:FL=1
MASFDDCFKVDESKCRSQERAVFQGANYRISVLSERLIRLEYNPNGRFSDNLSLLVKNRNFDVPPFKVEQDEKYLVITTNYFNLQYIKNKPFLGPKFAPDNNLKVSLAATDKVWYYGQPEVRNFRGGAISLDNYTGKISLDKGLYSTDGFVCLDDSYNYEIEMDGSIKEPDKDKVDLYLFMYKRDFGLCLKDYFTLTGFPECLPRYALGVWWNRERIYSFDNTKSLVSAFNKYHVPLSVLLLSEFWHIKDKDNYNLHKTGFTFNKELFPSPLEFTKYMHDAGVHVGVNIDPSEGVRKEEEQYLNMAQELGVSENALIPFNVLSKDFMASFVKNMIDPLIDLGVDIFWLDYKKDLDGINLLNYYYNAEFKKYSEKRLLTFSRSGLIAPHTCGVLYSGETIVSWDTLKYLPFYNSLAANKGVTWWSHDVGGYKDGTEDSELYTRYVQFSAFSPIFRFSAKRGIYYKREPWMWDIKTFTIVRDYILLRQRLIPYIYSEGFKYAKLGTPLIGPIYYSYPEIYDEPAYKNEYYFGKELFIAPITKPKDMTMNRSIERIFLPDGVWYDFKTGKKFVGNKRYVTFYKEDEYPIFAKAGSIVPLANLSDDINSSELPKSMELNIFPGKSNIYKLYEDDGITKKYQDGYFNETIIDYNYMVNNYTVIIRTNMGKERIIPGKRDYKVRFRNTRKPDSVDIYINGDKFEGSFKTYEDENDFVVEICDVDTSKQLTLNCKGKDIEINAVRIINEDINSIISDLKITTKLKEEIADIFFGSLDIKQKRIRIKKLKGLDKRFVRMFIKLLEYIAEI